MKQASLLDYQNFNFLLARTAFVKKNLIDFRPPVILNIFLDKADVLTTKLGISSLKRQPRLRPRQPVNAKLSTLVRGRYLINFCEGRANKGERVIG